MLFPNGKWLMCAPRFFGVEYEINPWMSVARKPETSLASGQWRNLHHTLIRLGAWVEYIEPQPGLPDMVFTANGGLTYQNKVVLPRFKFPERAGEAPFFRQWFYQRGFQLYELKEGGFEGEGDAFVVGENLFGGFGFRSDRTVYEEIRQLFGLKRIIYCELQDPRFYHLDTCFCPISTSQALCFPDAFSKDSLTAMKGALELIAVPEDEAQCFACNSVVLGKSIVIPSGAPKTIETLKSLGFEVYPVEVGEFLKAGGAVKCLSLSLA